MSLSQWQKLFNAPIFDQPFSAALTIDFNNGPIQRVVLTGNVTIDFTNIQDGMIYTLHLTQDGVGGRTATFNGVRTRFGVIGSTLSLTANTTDVFLGFGVAGTLRLLPIKGFGP